MAFFDLIPTRLNGQDIEASWFNIIKTFLNSYASQNTVPDNINILGAGNASWTYGATPGGEVNVAESTSENADMVINASIETGFTFTANKSGELAKTIARIVDRGDAGKDGTIVAQLYATSGGVPTGSVLDTSNAFNTSTLLLNSIVTNDFVFTGNISMVAGVTYAIIFLSTDSGTPYLRIGNAESFTTNYIENSSPPPTWITNSTTGAIYHQVFFDNLIDSGNLILSADIFASIPPLINDRHKIAAQTINLENNQVAYIEIDRSASVPTTSPVIVKSILEASSDGEKLVIAQAYGNACYIGLGTYERLLTGETIGLSNNGQRIEQLEASKQDLSEKGAANGYAPLNAGIKIDPVYLPDSVIEYKGTWNANTNTPTLADGVGNTGDMYRCNVAGTQDLGSGSLTFKVGDWVTYSGTVWERSDFTDAGDLLTTKGDILTRDSSANLRLGVGTDGQVLTADSAQSSGLKWETPAVSASAINSNILHNGAMEINQRRGYLGSGTFTSGLAFVVDRFRIAEGLTNTKNVSYSQVVDVTIPSSGGFNLREAISLTNNASVITATTDSFIIQQIIEGSDLRQVLGNSVVFSFYAHSSVSGPYSVSINNHNGTRSYVVDFTINSASTWERKEIVVDFSSETVTNWQLDEGQVGAIIGITLGAGATVETSTLGSFQSGNFRQSTSGTEWIATNGATFKFSGAKLEVGTLSTEFNRSSNTLSGEIYTVKRYYNKSYEIGTVPGTITQNGCDVMMGGNGTNSFNSTSIVPMAITPTLTAYNPVTGATTTWYDSVALVSRAVISAGFSGKTRVAWYMATLPIDNAAYGHWTADTNF